ncbi:MAG TPA: hypothetical protein VD908_04485 [Cytophagales bacterium]|nr:hypothetical protein [Cytophagales bacterium]
MKKLLALMLMSGFFAFTSCDTNKKTSENEEVIETDTTDVSYEVEETVVETDTTTQTEEVSTEEQNQNQTQESNQ